MEFQNIAEQYKAELFEGSSCLILKPAAHPGTR